MIEQGKTFKQLCKEAKNRLKNGFWQEYKLSLDNELKKAENAGVSASKVKEYYSMKVAENIRVGSQKEDEFYLKVKNLLDTEGEVSDAIGRLTDKELFDSLSYEEKQKYTLKLSEQYIKALEKYKKDNFIKEL